MSKFAVGDYLEHKDHVLMKVEAVVEQIVPLYFCKGQSIHKEVLTEWVSEKELSESTKIVPDWHKFDNLQPGDMMDISDGDNRYARVLARLNDVILLSQSVDSSARTFLDLLDTEKEAVEAMRKAVGDNVVDLIKKKAQQAGSITRTQAIADNWYTLEELVLFNWKQVQDF